MEFKTLEDLKAAAIEIRDTITTIHLDGSKWYFFTKMATTPKHHYTYGHKNGITVFIDKFVMFVIPISSREIDILLEKAGYEPTYNMAYPFSDGAIPTDACMAQKWAMLCNLQ